MVYMCACTNVCVCLYMQLHLCLKDVRPTYTFVQLHVCMYVCLRTCACVCTAVYMDVCVCMRIYNTDTLQWGFGGGSRSPNSLTW